MGFDSFINLYMHIEYYDEAERNMIHLCHVKPVLAFSLTGVEFCNKHVASMHQSVFVLDSSYIEKPCRKSKAPVQCTLLPYEQWVVFLRNADLSQGRCGNLNVIYFKFTKFFLFSKS